MDEETAKAWGGEALKALMSGGLMTSVFGVAGGFVGFYWFESETGSTSCFPALGCDLPELPMVGTVASPMQAAGWFALFFAVSVLVVCGGFVLYKSVVATGSRPD